MIGKKYFDDLFLGREHRLEFFSNDSSYIYIYLFSAPILLLYKPFTSFIYYIIYAVSIKCHAIFYSRTA